MLASDVVTPVLEQYGFDATSDEVLGWVSLRHKVMVARSRCNRRTVDFGVTVADQAFYPVEDVIELYQFTVDGADYGKARHPDVYGYAQGQVVFAGLSGSGLMVADASAAGVLGLTLVPTPTVADLALSGFAAMQADTLSTVNDTLLVPDESVEALIEGTAAVGYARDAEQLQVAGWHNERFDAGCEELRRMTARRFRGAGPAAIRVAGINA